MLHSFHYRIPAPFADLRVLVLGSGHSGTDIAGELCATARSVTLSSHRHESADNIHAWVISRLHTAGKPTVADYHNYTPRRRAAPASPTAQWRCGVLRAGRCSASTWTWYCAPPAIHYRFPFLSPALSVCTEELHVSPLYARLFHPDEAGLLAFPALQWSIVPFPMAEVQCEWMARIITGHCKLATSAEQRAWVKEDEAEKRRRGLGGRYFERCDSMRDYVRWVIAQMEDADPLYSYRYSIDDDRRLRQLPTQHSSAPAPVSE